MDFEQLKQEAWILSEPILNLWKLNFETFIKPRSKDFQKHLEVLFSLYGKLPVIKPLIVSLHLFPETGHEKGEPAMQLAESMGIRKMGDILYWVSDSIFSTNTQEYIDDKIADSLAKILHEDQHANLQGEEFEELIKKAEVDPRVTLVKDKLSRSQEHYIEATNELITTYLDSYSQKILKICQPWEITSGKQPIIFKVNKKDCEQIFEAIIKTDVKNWKQNGPYSLLRKAWESKLGSLPEGYKTTQTNMGIMSKSVKSKSQSVYEIARSLDAGLIEKYIKEGKKIDLKFIADLYKMVENKLGKN